MTMDIRVLGLLFTFLLGSIQVLAAGDENEISLVEKKLFDVNSREDSLANTKQNIELYERLLLERGDESSSSSEKLKTVRLMIGLSNDEGDETLCSQTKRLLEYASLATKFMPFTVGGSGSGSSSSGSAMRSNTPRSNAYNLIRFHKDRLFNRCANLLAKKVRSSLSLSEKERTQMQLFKRHIGDSSLMSKDWDRIVNGIWEFLKADLPKDRENLLKRKKFDSLFKAKVLEPCQKISETLQTSLDIYNKSKEFVKFDEATNIWLSLAGDCKLILYRPKAMEQDVFDEAYSRTLKKEGFKFGLFGSRS